MKPLGIAVLLFLIGTFQTQAQPRKAYQISPGEVVSDVLVKQAVLYHYPQFREARVSFRDGRSGTAMMNYNRLLGEMQYIDAKGDTLSIANTEDLSLIAINRDTFYFQKGYLQLIADFNIKVARKNTLELSNRQRKGAMGQFSSASITTHDQAATTEGWKKVVADEVLTFSEYTTYFLADRFLQFKPLNKKNLYSILPKQQDNLDTYLQANPVNYLKEEDVLRLIGFLKTLR